MPFELEPAVIKSAILTAALAAAALPASAAIIYAENFDSYTPALNFNAFNAPGQVTDGTVDLIASGTFSIDCAGGTGNCLDLDGSTGNSGIFSFEVALPAASYTFSFWYTGNQRGGANDILTLELLQNGALVETSSIDLAPGAGPFTGLANLPLPAATYTFRFLTNSNDNVGPILDDILLESDVENEVPAPAALALFGLGLVALGARRR